MDKGVIDVWLLVFIFIVLKSKTSYRSVSKPFVCHKKHAFSVKILHKNYSICAVEQSMSAQQIYTGIILCSTNVIYEPFYCFFRKFWRGVILHVYIHVLLVIFYYVPYMKVGIQANMEVPIDKLVL